MSFSFNFAADADDLDDELDFSAEGTFSTATGTRVEEASEDKHSVSEAPFVELYLDDLLEHLPSRISYTSLCVPLDSPPSSSDRGIPRRSLSLHRRDLFDARFELLLEADEADEDAVEASREGKAKERDSDSNAAQEGATDLIPGVYEGGFKTWECALDLVAVLEQRFSVEGNSASTLRGKRIIELGCGTALPSLYLLRTLCSEPTCVSPRTALHLCDYNAQVLRLVTIPNLLLAWYFSDAAEQLRGDPSAKASEAGELSLTPALIQAFRASLTERHIELRFFAGGWRTLDTRRREEVQETAQAEPYDIVLTSETIYAPSTVPTLVSVLRRLTHRVPAPLDAQTDALAHKLKHTAIDGSTDLQQDSSIAESVPVPATATISTSLTLVAAKVLYFGVGGGLESFRAAVRQFTAGEEDIEGGTGGWSVPLRQVSTGIGRVVLSVGFER